MSETEEEPGIERGPDGAIISEEPVEIDEATAFPNRADPDHWAAISEVLIDLCKDLEQGATIENMIDCLRLHWKELVDVEATKTRGNDIELSRLQEAVTKQDEARPAQDARIAELTRRRP